MKLSLEEWQEQYFIPTSKLLEDVHLDFPGLDLTGIDLSEDVDLWIEAEYNAYLERDILSFREWVKQNFNPSEELLKDLNGMFCLDVHSELYECLKTNYKNYLTKEINNGSQN